MSEMKKRSFKDEEEKYRDKDENVKDEEHKCDQRQMSKMRMRNVGDEKENC
jgi:hypothetical protein